MSSFEIAQAYAAAGRWNEAVQLCNDALLNDPQDLALMNLLGVALASSGRGEESVTALTAATRIDPMHPRVVANLVIAQKKVGDLEGAALRLRQLCTINPADSFAFNCLGLMHLEQGNLEVAKKLTQRAAVLAVNDVCYWSDASIVMLQLGQVADAAALIGNALDASPDHCHTNTVAAGIALARGELDAAAIHANKALEVEPGPNDASAISCRIKSYRAASSAAALPSEAAPGLVLRGPFDAISGYGSACRSFVQTLRKQDVPLNLIGLLGHERTSTEAQNLPVPARALLNISIPPAVEPVPGLATVLYSMFEGTSISPAWFNHSKRCDLIIVPTHSSLLAWSASGIPEDRLRVCPLGVDPGPMAHDVTPLGLVSDDGKLISSYRHRFLNVSDLVPRKNLAGLFRVWLCATQRTDDAVLVLKTGRGKERDIAALRDLMIRSEIAVGRRFVDAAPISIINQMFDEAQMEGLFASANYYWSMSHGEGWDLPMSRAGAMGLSLIAPAHSAYLDYLNPSIARMIPASVVPASLPYTGAPHPPFFGLHWWQPDEAVAIGMIEAIVKDRDVGLQNARDHLMANFTWGQATSNLRQILLAEGMLG